LSDMPCLRSLVALVFASTCLIASGCGPLVKPLTTPLSTQDGDYSLFDAARCGSISLRVVDTRNMGSTSPMVSGRKTQSINDLESNWNGVVITLTSATRLLAGGQTTTLTPTQTRQTSFSNVGILQNLMPGSDYKLMVQLKNGTTVLGEGAAQGISVTAGQATSVTLYVNAVGDITFASTSYPINLNTAGQMQLLRNSTVSVSTTANNGTNVNADSTANIANYAYSLYKVDNTGAATGSAILSATGSVVAGNITFNMALPTKGGGDTDDDLMLLTIAGQDANYNPISVKTRTVEVLNGGAVTTFAGLAGQSGSADGSGTAARFNLPQGVAVDTSGNVYVADTQNDTIRKITSGGVVTTFAGSAGAAGSVDGVGSNARFNHPTGVAIDPSGNLIVTDALNDTIRVVAPNGTVSTLAGSAPTGGTSDGVGPSARFNQPGGVTVDASGSIYVSDVNNHAIRRVQR